MSERLTTYCDGCGKPKGEANHWHRALVFTSNVETLGRPLEEIAIAFGDIKSARIEGHELTTKDFCGSECLLKYASRFLKGEQLAKNHPE